MRPQDADPTLYHEHFSRPGDYPASVGERGYYPIEEAMAMVLNEAGATYPEAAAFLAIMVASCAPHRALLHPEGRVVDLAKRAKSAHH